MRMSSVEEYGLRCLLAVARHTDTESGPLPIQTIASNEGLSPEYVAKLMRILREAELVTSTRGAAGGYLLARASHEITILQAIEALDGALIPDDWCDKHTGKLDSCVHTENCTIAGLWRYLSSLLGAAMGQITLADLTSGRIAMMNRLHPAEATP